MTALANWSGQALTPGQQRQAKDVEFRALKIGTWLSTPDGELIAAAVEALAPPPYG